MSEQLISFIGHHGTSAEIFKKIIKGQFIKSRAGWLGAGVYFFEDDKEIALRWAAYKYKGKPLRYLQCKLTTHIDRLLDVSNPKSETSKKVNNFKEELYKQGKLKHKIINMSDEEFDCKILNLVCEKDGYDIVRNFTHTYTYEDRKHNKKGNITNGVELCVRNLECIEIEK